MSNTVSLGYLFWNISTPLWFSRNPLKERSKHLHLNNTLPSENYNWNSSVLQLNAKENSSSQKLASSAGSGSIPFSDQLLAGSLFEIWHCTSIVSRPIREKKESGFWTYDPTSKCIIPSSPASKYREREYDRRLERGPETLPREQAWGEKMGEEGKGRERKIQFPNPSPPRIRALSSDPFLVKHLVTIQDGGIENLVRRALLQD